jgi:hypothetical protein
VPAKANTIPSMHVGRGTSCELLAQRLVRTTKKSREESPKCRFAQRFSPRKYDKNSSERQKPFYAISPQTIRRTARSTVSIRVKDFAGCPNRGVAKPE